MHDYGGYLAFADELFARHTTAQPLVPLVSLDRCPRLPLARMCRNLASSEQETKQERGAKS